MAVAGQASAQQPTVTQPPPTTGQRQTFSATTALTPNRDVILEIPELSVDSIGLTVENVRAHVALDANAMNLVSLTAGVDVGIKKVQLGLVGVMAGQRGGKSPRVLPKTTCRGLTASRLTAAGFSSRFLLLPYELWRRESPLPTAVKADRPRQVVFD